MNNLISDYGYYIISEDEDGAHVRGPYTKLELERELQQGARARFCITPPTDGREWAMLIQGRVLEPKIKLEL